LKLDLTNDHLAGKEMYVGRFYLKQNKHIAAINRFKKVLTDYQTTSHVPEALHRMVEAYMELGIIDEARAAAAVLGYNYPGSSWYQDSYKLFESRSILAEGSAPVRARPAKLEAPAQSLEGVDPNSLRAIEPPSPAELEALEPPSNEPATALEEAREPL
jgi:outer membrane protein assembly factor BamD